MNSGYAHAICSTNFFFRRRKKIADEKYNFAGEIFFFTEKKIGRADGMRTS